MTPVPPCPTLALTRSCRATRRRLRQSRRPVHSFFPRHGTSVYHSQAKCQTAQGETMRDLLKSPFGRASVVTAVMATLVAGGFLVGVGGAVRYDPTTQMVAYLDRGRELQVWAKEPTGYCPGKSRQVVWTSLAGQWEVACVANEITDERLAASIWRLHALSAWQSIRWFGIVVAANILLAFISGAVALITLHAIRRLVRWIAQGTF